MGTQYESESGCFTIGNVTASAALTAPACNANAVATAPSVIVTTLARAKIQALFMLSPFE
ncbi:hypothetical protein DP49_5108 [Burkholderia pseudomallei]|nr:hypothetical protein DP49_5108 [Burkholderia pseudomallei]